MALFSLASYIGVLLLYWVRWVAVAPFSSSRTGVGRGHCRAWFRQEPGKDQPWEVAALWTTRPGSEGSSERAVFPAKGGPLVWPSSSAPWALHLCPNSHGVGWGLKGWQFRLSFCQPAPKPQLQQGRVAGQAQGSAPGSPCEELVGSQSPHPFPSPPVRRSGAGRRDPFWGSRPPIVLLTFSNSTPLRITSSSS